MQEMRANCDTLSSLRLISWGNVCSLISKSIVSQALHLELTDQVPGIFGSKVGGVPYLPDDAEIPCDAEGNPLQGEFGISMKPAFASLSLQDVHFEPMFVRMYNEDLPKQKITEISELGDAVGEMLSEEHGGFGHKISGYPGFIQWDPREENDPRTVLLFQLDSDYGSGKTKVMWGDAGICGLFLLTGSACCAGFQRCSL